MVFLEEGETFDQVTESVKHQLEEKISEWEKAIKVSDSKEVKKPTIRQSSVFAISDDTTTPPEVTEPLICPKCNEQMVKKEGKDYYLCSKHWGYPDMILKGEVKDKRF